MRQKVGDEDSVGKWAQRGDKLCVEFTDDDEESCYTVQITPDAVIFAKRIDMGPDGMEMMTAPIELTSSTEPGVYKFKTDLGMAGEWALSLGAKVQGETGTVENKLIVKATQ